MAHSYSSTIVCAVTPSISLFLIARFVQGSAVCSLIVAGYATIHELYDTQKAIYVLALMGSVGILAPAFGPLLGGFLLEMMSWRYLFWILAIGAIVNSLLLLKWMPESNPKEKRLPFLFKKVFISYALIVKNKHFMLSTIVLCLIYSGLIAWLTMGPLLVGPLQRMAIEASEEPMGLRMAIFSSCLGIAGVLSSAISSYLYNNTTIILASFLFCVAMIAILLNFFRDNVAQ